MVCVCVGGGVCLWLVGAQGNSLFFFCAGKWESEKIVPHAPGHNPRCTAHPVEAKTQGNTLVKTVCQTGS